MRDTTSRRWGFPCFPFLLVDMLSPTTPAKRVGPSSGLCPTRTSLPPVQAGSAFASCISGPTRRSHVLRPADLQTALRRLLSPKLRLLRYLHTRWDSYPAGTTFTGAGLSPAGITELFTAHLDQYSQSRRPWFRGNRQGYIKPTSEPAEKTENDGQALGTTSSAHSWSRRCQPAQTSSGENSRRKLQNVVADSTAVSSCWAFYHPSDRFSLNPLKISINRA